VGQGRRPRARCTRSAHPGGEGSPSGPHYEGSAFNGWTGARRAGRKPRARGVGIPHRLAAGSTVPTAQNRRTERRKAQRPLARGRAAFLARGRGRCGAVRRSAPSLFEGMKMTKGAPGASNNTGDDAWLFDICISLSVRSREGLPSTPIGGGHPGPIPRSPRGLGARLRGGERKEFK
jgi:hypothetical protein